MYTPRQALFNVLSIHCRAGGTSSCKPLLLQFSAQMPEGSADITVDLTFPATQKHIDKNEVQEVFMVTQQRDNVALSLVLHQP